MMDSREKIKVLIELEVPCPEAVVLNARPHSNVTALVEKLQDTVPYRARTYIPKIRRLVRDDRKEGIIMVFQNIFNDLKDAKHYATIAMREFRY